MCRGILSPGCKCHEEMPTLFSPGLAHGRPSVSPDRMNGGARTHCPGEKQRRGRPAGTALGSQTEEGAVAGKRGQDDRGGSPGSMCPETHSHFAPEEAHLVSSFLHPPPQTLAAVFIFPAVLPGESRGRLKEHGKSFPAHILRNLFLKAEVWRAAILSLSLCQGLARSWGMEGPAPPCPSFLLRERCMSECPQAGPVQPGRPTVLECSALGPIWLSRVLGSR